MIEDIMNRDQKDRQRAKRMGVAPSASLRRHFLALARQSRQWFQNHKASKPTKMIGITSLNYGAGNSTVAYNLAAALTSLERTRVLLVEADFGRHYITRRLGQSRSPGLSELILDFAGVDEVIHETPITDLDVIGCGQKSDQEALELPFDLMPQVMSEKFSEYGYVVFDLPIANHLTACHSISTHLDGLILTVEANQIDHRQINRFRSHMKSLGVEIIGLVINKQ
jgi:Mrp family chromosome partitioning ATPase